jgi:hypothetical protein
VLFEIFNQVYSLRYKFLGLSVFLNRKSVEELNKYLKNMAKYIPQLFNYSFREAKVEGSFFFKLKAVTSIFD